MINEINHPNFISKTNTSNKNKYNTVTQMPGYGLNFEALLKEQIVQKEGVQFSKHAKERVEQRGIDVSESFLTNLNNAVDKARAKGAKDVVIIGEKGAFIINIPNNVVVTAVSGDEIKDNIFTNIDSAVLL